MSNPSVSVLDVGQGSCLIATDGGETLVVDCPAGWGATAVSRMREGGELGPLKLILGTHRDLDHIGGLPRILQECGSQAVAINRSYSLPSHPAEKAKIKAVLLDIFSYIEEHAVNQFELTRGTVVKGVRIDVKCLWPDQHAVNLGTLGTNTNRTSMLLKLGVAGRWFLLAGDLVESTVWRRLIAEDDLTCDVFILPHHGGAFPDVASILAAASPTHCVFSFGRRNPYGHPVEATLNAAVGHGSRVMCTEVTTLCHAGEVVSPECAGSVRFEVAAGALYVAPSVARHANVIAGWETPRCRVSPPADA